MIPVEKTQTKEHRPYHYGVADMTARNKKIRKNLPEEEIDRIVVQQADNDSEWEEPIHVLKLSLFLWLSLRPLLHEKGWLYPAIKGY